MRLPGRSAREGAPFPLFEFCLQKEQKMKYAKPEVTSTSTATVAIKGHQPGSKIGAIIEGGHTFVTAPAYEADE